MGRQIGHGDMQGIAHIHNAKPWSRAHCVRKIKTQIRSLGEITKTAFAYTRFLDGLKKVPDGHIPCPERREVKEIFRFIAKACRFFALVNQSSHGEEKVSFSS